MFYAIRIHVIVIYYKITLYTRSAQLWLEIASRDKCYPASHLSMLAVFQYNSIVDSNELCISWASKMAAERRNYVAVPSTGGHSAIASIAYLVCAAFLRYSNT